MKATFDRNLAIKLTALVGPRPLNIKNEKKKVLYTLFVSNINEEAEKIISLFYILFEGSEF